MNFSPLGNRELPSPPPLKKAIGVGIVVMGLAIGTGELIMWPHIVAKAGLGVLWLALFGITAQMFINREVARHTIATGESFFTTSARIFKWSAVFWLISAILLYIWPGWASAIGTILKELFGFGDYRFWAWGSLALVLLLTYGGKIAYETLEKSLKVTVVLFTILLLVISFLNLTPALLLEAIKGVFNFGFIPANVGFDTLLSAVVFAGAGGMLNLTVSLWYRDKEFGMAKYAGRIVNPITGKPEAVTPIGNKFEINKESLARFKGWMKFVLIDQGIIFWLIGFTTIFLLSVNAYAVLSPKGIVPEGLNVAITQAEIFKAQWGVIGGKIFLVMAFLMLFSVMWTVIDALSRIVSDIVYTNSREGKLSKVFHPFKDLSLSHLYYGVITLVVIISAFLIPFGAPLTLLKISAVLGGLTMAIYSPFLIYLNNRKLPKELRPGIFTNFAMTGISAFFIWFAIRTLISL